MTYAEYQKVLVDQHVPIISAVKIMNQSSIQVLLVIDTRQVLVGVVTDGDIRRAIANEIDFKKPISLIMNKSPLVLPQPVDKQKALELMKSMGIRHIPIVDSKKHVVGLILWNEFLKNGDLHYQSKPNKVVIMAGGKGTRLDVFTKILPKPLIPVGEKPIIDHIMDNFSKFGFDNFLLSLNYKAEMIKMYFADNPHNYGIEYVEEKEFLGTAGALSLARKSLTDTFIVSNCDVIIDGNLDLLFSHHKDNHNHATILGTLQNIKIPYGVLKTSKENLVDIVEKPEYNFVISSGIYVLEPEMVELIPDNEPMDMPDLLLKAKDKGLKVQVFPMTCSWFDVGQWGEYKRAVDHITSLGCAN